MISKFWYRWLHAAVLGLMLFGLSMLFLPHAIRQLFGLVIYSEPGAMEAMFGTGATAYITLAHGVLGAVMVGWSTVMLLVLRGPFRRAQHEGWMMLALPLALWFLADTGFSLWAGFWHNAVLNAVIALLFAVPLVATRRHFRAGRS